MMQRTGGAAPGSEIHFTGAQRACEMNLAAVLKEGKEGEPLLERLLQAGCSDTRCS